MHVRMVLEGLAPGVQHGGDADVGTEVLGIGAQWWSASRRRP